MIPCTLVVAEKFLPAKFHMVGVSKTLDATSKDAAICVICGTISGRSLSLSPPPPPTPPLNHPSTPLLNHYFLSITINTPCQSTTHVHPIDIVVANNIFLIISMLAICVIFTITISGLLIGITAEYYTSNSFQPVKDLVNACRTGAGNTTPPPSLCVLYTHLSDLVCPPPTS